MGIIGSDGLSICEGDIVSYKRFEARVDSVCYGSGLASITLASFDENQNVVYEGEKLTVPIRTWLKRRPSPDWGVLNEMSMILNNTATGFSENGPDSKSQAGLSSSNENRMSFNQLIQKGVISEELAEDGQDRGSDGEYSQLSHPECSELNEPEPRNEAGTRRKAHATRGREDAGRRRNLFKRKSANSRPTRVKKREGSIALFPRSSRKSKVLREHVDVQVLESSQAQRIENLSQLVRRELGLPSQNSDTSPRGVASSGFSGSGSDISGTDSSVSDSASYVSDSEMPDSDPDPPGFDLDSPVSDLESPEPSLIPFPTEPVSAPDVLLQRKLAKFSKTDYGPMLKPSGDFRSTSASSGKGSSQWPYDYLDARDGNVRCKIVSSYPHESIDNVFLYDIEFDDKTVLRGVRRSKLKPRRLTTDDLWQSMVAQQDTGSPKSVKKNRFDAHSSGTQLRAADPSQASDSGSDSDLASKRRRLARSHTRSSTRSHGRFKELKHFKDLKNDRRTVARDRFSRSAYEHSQDFSDDESDDSVQAQSLEGYASKSNTVSLNNKSTSLPRRPNQQMNSIASYMSLDSEACLRLLMAAGSDDAAGKAEAVELLKANDTAVSDPLAVKDLTCRAVCLCVNMRLALSKGQTAQAESILGHVVDCIFHFRSSKTDHQEKDDKSTPLTTLVTRSLSSSTDHASSDPHGVGGGFLGALTTLFSLGRLLRLAYEVGSSTSQLDSLWTVLKTKLATRRAFAEPAACIAQFLIGAFFAGSVSSGKRFLGAFHSSVGEYMRTTCCLVASAIAAHCGTPEIGSSVANSLVDSGHFRLDLVDAMKHQQLGRMYAFAIKSLELSNWGLVASEVLTEQFLRESTDDVGYFRRLAEACSSIKGLYASSQNARWIRIHGGFAPRYSATRKLGFGKHADRTFEWVRTNDKPYCNWLQTSDRSTFGLGSSHVSQAPNLNQASNLGQASDLFKSYCGVMNRAVTGLLIVFGPDLISSSDFQTSTCLKKRALALILALEFFKHSGESTETILLGLCFGYCLLGLEFLNMTGISDLFEEHERKFYLSSARKLPTDVWLARIVSKVDDTRVITSIVNPIFSALNSTGVNSNLKDFVLGRVSELQIAIAQKLSLQDAAQKSSPKDVSALDMNDPAPHDAALQNSTP